MEIPADAIDPFFDKRVAVEVKRDGVLRRGSLKASIFDEGMDATIAQDAYTESATARFALMIRRIDWFAAFPAPPQQGDLFTSPDTGKAYALVECNPFDFDIFSIVAREVPYGG